MKTIKLENTGQEMIVDDEDYERLILFVWTDLKGRIQRCERRKFRLKEGEAPTLDMRRTRTYSIPIANEVMQNYKLMYDHIDRNYLNNQKSNLRDCTHQQNLMNQTKQQGTSSKYKGVSWSKPVGKWHAYIKKNQRRIHLGYFKKEEDAALAYNTAAKNLFGEFAALNNI